MALSGYPLSSRALLFGATLCACFLYLVIRTPYSFFEPGFFAEDGTNYFTDIANSGFLNALVQTHQGYFVFGTLTLSGLSFVVDRVFLGNDVRQMPFAMALVSGIYFALLASLPILLLRKRLSNVWLVCLATFIVATPLGDGDNAIIGRLSNVGYSCVYLAVILILYRIDLKPSGVRLFLCDLCLFVCANTNPVVYLLVPLAALPYLGGWNDWRRLLKNQSFLSFLTLLAGLAAVAAHLAALKPYGTRDHLGGSFVWKNAVEMLLAREFLYPLLFPVYAYLKDGFVILLTVVIVASIVWLIRRQTWEKNQFYLVVIVGFSIFAIASAVFRPGLSTAFQSY